MPVRVGKAVVGVKRARIDFGDDGDLNFSWRSGQMTGAQVDALQEMSDTLATYETLAAAIVEWDLLDEDGAPVPLDAEVLYATVPTHLASMIFERMRTDGAGEANGAS